MIDGIKCFDQPVENYIGTYGNIKNIKIEQGDNCPTHCLLIYLYFKKYLLLVIRYELSAMVLSKQLGIEWYLK